MTHERSSNHEGVEWVRSSERLPEAPPGQDVQVWVCAHRKHDDKRYVFIGWWVNRPAPPKDCEDPPDWALDDGNDGYADCVGWAHISKHPDYDEYYELMHDQDAIIAWAPIARPEAPQW